MTITHAEMPLAPTGSFRSAGACPPPHAEDKPRRYGLAFDNVGVVDLGREGTPQIKDEVKLGYAQ